MGWQVIEHEPKKIKQRDGKDPDIIVKRKTYIPTREPMGEEPQDGISKQEFFNILDKASQPKDEEK